MFGDTQRKEILNRAGREILRAARATDEETRQAAAAPFLYARIHARIEEGRPQQALSESRLMWLVARRAVPALALIAVFALSSFWVFGNRVAAPSDFSSPDFSNIDVTADSTPLEPILSGGQPALVTSACSIATKDECLVSTSDVVSILMHTSERQEQR